MYYTCYYLCHKDFFNVFNSIKIRRAYFFQHYFTTALGLAALTPPLKLEEEVLKVRNCNEIFIGFN